MPFIPSAPAAFNWWEGNKFRVPPLGQYARPQYAEALAPVVAQSPGLAAALPQAAPQGGLLGGMDGRGIGERQDLSAEYATPGRGMQAVTGDWRDLFGGPTQALGSIAVQALANGLAGNPDRPITGIGLGDTYGSIAEALGFGGHSGAHYQAAAPEYAYADPDLSALSGTGETTQADPYGDGYGGYASEQGFGDGGLYAKGGMVRGLLGPNPPGPDDGFAGLDRGEFVVRKSMAQKHRGLLEAINKGKVSKRKSRSLLD